MALVLLIINLCGTITLIGLLPASMSQTESLSRNKNETIPNGTELNETQIKNQSNLDEDEFVLFLKQISPQNSSKNDSRKYSRKSGVDNMFIVLLLDLLTIFTTFVIIFSFCVDQNECCNENSQQDICCCACVGTWCTHYCLRAKCKSRSRSKNGGAANLAILIFIFLLIYCAVNACGKHVSRYVGVTINMIFFLAMFVLSNIFYFNNTSIYDPGLQYSIIIISGLISLTNFLGLLLPNLICCSSLRYEEVPSKEPLTTPPPSELIGVSNQSTPLYPQAPAYVPPSSDFSNVPTYPPAYSSSGYDSSQGNYYINPQNPQNNYTIPPPAPL
jgi:hypothetical protein